MFLSDVEQIDILKKHELAVKTYCKKVAKQKFAEELKGDKHISKKHGTLPKAKIDPPAPLDYIKLMFENEEVQQNTQLDYIKQLILFYITLERILANENSEDEVKECVTLNLLSPVNGYTQSTMIITDDNKESVNKWLDKETNSIYCIEVYKDGKSQYYYTSKEMFDSLKRMYDET